MTVGNLIAKKDYDYMAWYVVGPDGETEMFCGVTASKNGELVPLDSDSYYKATEVKSYEEWSNEKIKNGLTIVYECDWSSSADL